MPLPKIANQNYELILPYTKKTITFRPYLVQEEKALLAASGGSEKEIRSAMIRLLDACCSDTVDFSAGELTTFEFEYLFLQIRAKSVGETVEMTVMCQTKDCPGEHITKIDLSKLEPTIDENTNFIIKLNDTISIKMYYPSVTTLTENITSKNENDPTFAFDIVSLYIDNIIEDDNVYTRKDFTKKELENFIDQLTHTQFEKLSNFIETSPTISHEITFTCDKCQKENIIKLEGMSDFFT